MKDTELLTKLYSDILLRTATLAECTARSRDARNSETDALNRLNEAQKAFDEYVVALKKNAPTESDWKRALAPVFRVP